MSILIVEDNEDNLTMLDYLLRAHGYATVLEIGLFMAACALP
jgi:CheY-like chemotaxis protein